MSHKNDDLVKQFDSRKYSSEILDFNCIVDIKTFFFIYNNKNSFRCSKIFIIVCSLLCNSDQSSKKKITLSFQLCVHYANYKSALYYRFTLKYNASVLLFKSNYDNLIRCSRLHECSVYHKLRTLHEKYNTRDMYFAGSLLKWIKRDNNDKNDSRLSI